MIRMVLIYTALFAIAGGAIWMKPSSNSQDFAAIDESELANLTHLVLTDLNADSDLHNEVPVTRALASSQRPLQRPLRQIVDPNLSAQVLSELQGVGTPRSSALSREVATLVSSALSQGATASEIEEIFAQRGDRVDLAPLLEIPGSVEKEGGTRFLASALMRQQAQSARPGIEDLNDIATLSVSPSPSDPVERLYVVQPGDSLGSIADEFYGTSSAFRLIFDANRDTLGSIDAIRVGQSLRLP